MNVIARGIATILTTLALVAGMSSTADASTHHKQDTTHKRLCVADTVNGGQVCGTLWMHGTHSKIYKEGTSKSTTKHLPRYVRADPRYIGWSDHDVSDGIILWSVKSKTKAHRWHLYELR